MSPPSACTARVTLRCRATCHGIDRRPPNGLSQPAIFGDRPPVTIRPNMLAPRRQGRICGSTDFWSERTEREALASWTQAPVVNDQVFSPEVHFAETV